MLSELTLLGCRERLALTLVRELLMIQGFVIMDVRFLRRDGFTKRLRLT